MKVPNSDEYTHPKMSAGAPSKTKDNQVGSTIIMDSATRSQHEPFSQFRIAHPKLEGLETARNLMKGLTHEYSSFRFHEVPTPDQSNYIRIVPDFKLNQSLTKYERTESEEGSSFLNYDDKKQDLALDREQPDITRDKVSYRETYSLVELHALKAYFPESVIQIDGLPVIAVVERPSLTKANFRTSPVYFEWRKLIEEAARKSWPDALHSNNLQVEVNSEASQFSPIDQAVIKLGRQDKKEGEEISHII